MPLPVIIDHTTGTTTATSHKTTVWTGSTDSDYNDATNWDSGLASDGDRILFKDSSVAVDAGASPLEPGLAFMGVTRTMAATIGTSSQNLKGGADTIVIDGGHALDATLWARAMFIRRVPGAGLTLDIETDREVTELVVSRTDKAAVLSGGTWIRAICEPGSKLDTQSGSVIKTANINGGTLTAAGNITTCDFYQGRLRTQGTATISTLNVYGPSAVARLRGSGNVNTLNMWAGEVTFDGNRDTDVDINGGTIYGGVVNLGNQLGSVSLNSVTFRGGAFTSDGVERTVTIS